MEIEMAAEQYIRSNAILTVGKGREKRKEIKGCIRSPECV